MAGSHMVDGRLGVNLAQVQDTCATAATLRFGRSNRAPTGATTGWNYGLNVSVHVVAAPNYTRSLARGST
eukprot:12922038-Prorocentrum_lima.AAC.1